jgi:hypothetical protein
MACSRLGQGAQAVRQATSANVSDALGMLSADVGSFADQLSGKLGADMNTLIDDLQSAFVNNGNGPQLTGPVAPIQSALNQALSDCQGADREPLRQTARLIPASLPWRWHGQRNVDIPSRDLVWPSGREGLSANDRYLEPYRGSWR